MKRINTPPIGLSLLIALVYFAAAELGLSLASVHQNVTPVWPPTGIAIASLLIFGFEDIIAYCSTFTDLVPGDVIVTGTPGGVGAARNPPLFMKAGDVIEVEVKPIGVLRNRVVVG